MDGRPGANRRWPVRTVVEKGIWESVAAVCSSASARSGLQHRRDLSRRDAQLALFADDLRERFRCHALSRSRRGASRPRIFGHPRSVRFGVAEAHGQGAAVQINRYLEEGAARFDPSTSKLLVDLPKLEASIARLPKQRSDSANLIGDDRDR